MKAILYTNNYYYWNLLKDLSNERKVDLINRLAQSLVHKKEATEQENIECFFGIWKDENFLDADEMVEEIRNSRIFKQLPQMTISTY